MRKHNFKQRGIYMRRKKLSLLFLSVVVLASTGCASIEQRDSEIASIYQSYKSNGGTLDYETWLNSIKGKDGTTGKDGTNGKDGVDGKDGKRWQYSFEWKRFSIKDNWKRW